MHMLTPSEKYLFDTSGVLIRRKIFSSEQVATAIQRISEKIDPTAWKFPTLDLHNVFWDWMTDDAIFQPVQQMCGPHVRMDHAFGVRGGSGSKAPAQLHGGPDSSQYSCFYHDVGGDLGLIGQLSVGVVLQGQTPETGGFCYLPGSHKAIKRVDGKQVFAEYLQSNPNHPAIVVPSLSPGDVLFFSESLVHGDTGPRLKQAERLMAYYKFCPGWMCWRDPQQQEKYRVYAATKRAAMLMAPPWTGRFTDDNHTMGIKNERRQATDG